MKRLLLIAACISSYCFGMSTSRAALPLIFTRLFARTISARSENNCVVKKCDCLKKWVHLQNLQEEGIKKEEYLNFVRSADSNTTFQQKQDARTALETHNKEMMHQKGLLATNIVEQAKCREIMYALGVAPKLLN